MRKPANIAPINDTPPVFDRTRAGRSIRRTPCEWELRAVRAMDAADVHRAAGLGTEQKVTEEGER